MKPVSYPKYFLLLLLALGLGLSSVLRAQEAPPAPAAPAPATTPERPADTTQPEVAPESAQAEVTEAAEAEKAPDAPPAPEEKSSRHHRNHRTGNERVGFGSNSTLAAGESADAVISILGSSTSAGDVADSVVSVIGSSRVEAGTVGNAVVSVLGNSFINGEVHGEVVAVLGNVELGPKAVVHGEVVCIGGQVTRADGAVLKGNIQNVAVAGKHFNFSPLHTWFTECVLYARPLAFHRDLFWAWTFALGCLGFYALIALIAPAGVNKCIETLEQRPGSSLLAALLTLLLTPVAYILLALTLAIVIGFVLIPAFSLGLFLAAIFGKIVMLAWLGRRFTKLVGDGPLAHPVFGVLVGGVLVLLLYTIPVVGFITYKLIGILGLGVVVYTLIRKMGENRPPKPAAVAAAPAPATVAGFATTSVSTGVVPPPEPPPVLPVISAAPPVISAATLPRAGFWIRLGAAALDFLMVFIGSLIILNYILDLHNGAGLNFLLWIAYHPIMWKMKGTTIGGIICGLKVVRVDDRPIDWTVAIVRAITAFLSFFAAGIGFIWVAFDDEKQSWHDKVAGTTIVRVPKGMALL